MISTLSPSTRRAVLGASHGRDSTPGWPLRFGLGRRHLRDVGLRQVQGERAAHSGSALQTDLTAQQARQLAADGEAQTGAAVLAAGGAIRLLERLEDDSLLVLRNADAGVGDGERDHATSRD